MKKVKIIFVGIFMALTGIAQAAPYATIGGGVPMTELPVNSSSIGLIGVGYQVTKTAAIELDYRWLGSDSGYFGYSQDPTMTNTGTAQNPVFTCATDPCNHQKQYINTSSKGAALSGVFEIQAEQGRVGHTLRLGVYNRNSQYADRWDAPVSVTKQNVSAESSGLSAMVGVGVRIDNLRVEIVYYDRAFYKSAELVPLVATYINYIARF